MSCSRVSPSYSLVFFAPLAVRASLGSVFVVAIRFLGQSLSWPSGSWVLVQLDSRQPYWDSTRLPGTCWIVNGNWGLEKHRKFSVSEAAVGPCDQCHSRR